MALLSYIGAHWALMIATGLVVVVLLALTWFLKNVKFAIAAFGVLALGFAYQAIDMQGYQRRVFEQAHKEAETLQNRLDTLNAIAFAYKERYVTDQKQLNKLKELVSETPPNSAPCLDVDTVRRVFSIR